MSLLKVQLPVGSIPAQRPYDVREDGSQHYLGVALVLCSACVSLWSMHAVWVWLFN